MSCRRNKHSCFFVNLSEGRRAFDNNHQDSIYKPHADANQVSHISRCGIDSVSCRLPAGPGSDTNKVGDNTSDTPRLHRPRHGVETPFLESRSRSVRLQHGSVGLRPLCPERGFRIHLAQFNQGEFQTRIHLGQRQARHHRSAPTPFCIPTTARYITMPGAQTASTTGSRSFSP